MEQQAATKPIHGEPKPKNVPHDMVATPPIPCSFAPGDAVVYTNDYGAQFNRTVKGFSREVRSYGFVYLDTDCWWMPVQPESLRLRGAA